VLISLAWPCVEKITGQHHSHEKQTWVAPKTAEVRVCS